MVPFRRSLLGQTLSLAIVLVALLLAYRWFWRSGDDTVVVYCAHDAVFADAVIAAFRQRTGIQVSVRYDSEATKSLGLLERLIAEADHPQCDVLWNNEQLGTMDLAARGLLSSYRGSGWDRIPAGYKDAEGRWTGFAGRVRVMIVNTMAMHATTAEVRARLLGDLHRVAIAKPLFGTTLTHYSVLWNALGSERLQAWHRESRERGLREVDGNGMVKTLVADGACDLGFTDNDDYFEAVDDGKPVAMIPARLGDLVPGGGDDAIVIPNTVAIIAGAPHRHAAEQFADFLLSADAELMLATSASRQIPLGTVDERLLPPAVRDLRAQVAHATNLTGLAPARTACLAWLKQLYAP
jgi:iron(III) transport system substrate-binding protein